MVWAGSISAAGAEGLSSMQGHLALDAGDFDVEGALGLLVP